jgi:ubiquinone/menaquinone biosynthesis C-methylase UbiE
MTNPAETYESFMVPTLFRPWASHLVEAAAPQAGERILDVGCGTGIVARLAAAHGGANGEITGIDISPHMLEVARTMAKREGAAVRWHEGRAEELPFQDGSFDLVLSQFALMFFADREAALREMRRVLANGGRTLLSVWQGLDKHPFYQTLHESIERRLGMSGVAEIFALGDAGELNGLLSAAGFRDIDVRPVSMPARFPNPEGFLAGEIDVDTASIPSMQHLSDAERKEVTEAIRADMEEPLRQVTESDHVVIPFHALIVKGYR